MFIKILLKGYANAGKVEVDKAKGALFRGLVLDDVKLTDVKQLPKGSVIRIQKLQAGFNSLSLSGIYADIFNGRLIIPGSDNLLFGGTYRNAGSDFNFYCAKIHIRHILDLFIRDGSLKKISGELDGLDINIRGNIFSPRITGTFYVKKLSQNGFFLLDSNGTIDLGIRRGLSGVNLSGNIIFSGGTAFGDKTARINLNNGKIIFTGDPRMPVFDLRADSRVSDVKINILLTGTIEKPQLKLTSEPAISEERLLIMLATGKSWKGLDAPPAEGKIPTDIAADFVDYFIFSGTGSKIAERYGISDVAFTLERGRTGVEIKKDIFKNIEAGYGVEQSGNQNGNKDTTHKISGEYKVTDNISLGAEREIKQSSEGENKENTSQENDKVLIKFKKGF